MVFRPLYGEEANLETTPFHAGYMYITRDTHKMFVDIVNAEEENERICVGSSAAYEGRTLTGTLLASGWTNGTQTITIQGVTPDLPGIIGVADNATDAQYAAAAGLRKTAQGTNTVTVEATGDVPEIDIPVQIIVPALTEIDTSEVEAALANHTGNTNNPHNVTAAQVGAIPATEKGTASGVASLDSSGKVPAEQLPSMNYIPVAEKGAASGVATLDATGKVPSGQLPAMNYIPTTEKGAASGVAALNTNGAVPIAEGGTEATTAAAALANLIGGATSAASVTTDDIVGLLDGTNSTGKQATLSALAAVLSAGGAKIQTGSYVGTGTYGASNPCSLTFDFEPKLVIVASCDYALGCELTCVQGQTYAATLVHGIGSSGASSAMIKVTFDGNTVSWYAGDNRASADTQLNRLRATYVFTALG